MTEPKTAARATAKKEPELNIFQRINAISLEAGALAPESKGGVPFAFRGIDGTVAHLTPFLHKYGVFASPKTLSHIVTERILTNAQGAPTGKVVKTAQVEVEYTFYAPDGSSIVVVTPGLADDFSDRCSAQAMSVAYRIALLQLFHLPTHTREPEETGQDVLNGSDAASAPSAPKAVAAAQAKAAGGPAPTASAPLGKLQGEAKALGRELGKGAEELNALGLSLGEGNPDWFGSPEVMAKIVASLRAEKAEKAA